MEDGDCKEQTKPLPHVYKLLKNPALGVVRPRQWAEDAQNQRTKQDRASVHSIRGGAQVHPEKNNRRYPPD